MKILYHHRIASKDGQYVHVEELINALRVIGHEVIVVGPVLVDKGEFGYEGGIVSVLKKFIPGAVYEFMEFSYSIVAYMRLRKAILRHKPDCLYERYNLFMPAGVWVKRRYKIPMISEVNAPLYEERKRYNGISIDRLAKWSESYVWRNADYVLPVTGVLAKKVENAGVSDEKIIVVPNSINPERFRAQAEDPGAKARLGLSDKIVLGFVGFVREWHGLERVIEFIAESHVHNLALLLVGDGPARESLERRAAELGVSNHMQLTGIVQRDEVSQYIAAFDIALQPAVAPYACPLKIYEYMAMGKPIIAPAMDNIIEILEDGSNAVLFQPNDDEDFRNALRRLCDDPALRRQLGDAGSATLQSRDISWQSNARRIIGLYHCLGID